MSKQILVSFCLYLSFYSAAQSNIDVLHYSFALELSDTSNSIQGRATIRFRALKKLTTIELDLTKNSQGKGMNIQSVYSADKNDNALSFNSTNDKVSVSFETPVEAGSEKAITISYGGVPKDGLIISKNKYGRRTFFADNWPNRGHNWIPCVDDPADKATVEFIITAPQHYQVVANGVLIEETNLDKNRKLTHWKEDVPLSTKVMVIGAAHFAVNLAGIVDRIPVYSWVYPEDRGKGFYDYAQATEILPFFIKNVGPYGYKKLANVQSKTTFGGLENANTIFYHENSVDSSRRSETLLAHEIAHQWFGNMATEKSFAHLWLSEGFATYMTILYMENKYGPDTARYMLAEDREQVIAFTKTNNKPIVDETKDFMQLLNANSYQKGGWILHMLRKQLGDSVFYKSVRSYYAAFAGKNADTRDLQKVFEKVSGKDLSVFFDQWLYSPGVPVLDVKWKFSPAEKKLSVVITQLQEKPFTFPLDIQVKNTGSAQVKTIIISKKEQTFSWPVKEKVEDITLDPGITSLFSATIKPG